MTLGEHFKLYAAADVQHSHLKGALEALLHQDTEALNIFVKSYSQVYEDMLPLEEILAAEYPEEYLANISDEKGDVLYRHTIHAFDSLIQAEAIFSGFCRAVESENDHNNASAHTFITNQRDNDESEQRLAVLQEDYATLTQTGFAMPADVMQDYIFKTAAAAFGKYGSSFKHLRGFDLQRESLKAVTAMQYLSTIGVYNQLLTFGLAVQITQSLLGGYDNDEEKMKFFAAEMRKSLAQTRVLQFMARELWPDTEIKPTIEKTLSLKQIVMPLDMRPH